MHNSNDIPFQDNELKTNDRTSTPTRKLPEESLRVVVEGLSYVPADAIGEGIVYGLETSAELAAGLIEVLAVGLEGSGELLGAVIEAIGAILGGLLSGL